MIDNFINLIIIKKGLLVELEAHKNYVPMTRWSWMIAYELLLGPQHMQLKAKTHAHAINHYWASRQTEQQGSCLCNCQQARK